MACAAFFWPLDCCVIEQLGASVEVQFIPFDAVSPSVRSVFSGTGRAEADWSWFATIAQSALLADEELVIAALLDERGVCHSALPLVRKGGLLRGAVSCYTTEFLPPLQEKKSAFLLGRGLGEKCLELRLDSLHDQTSFAVAFLDGLRSAGFAIETYRHFANWYEGISDFATYWEARDGRLKSLVHRKGKRLFSEKRIAFERVDLLSDVDRGIALYETIYARSWKEPEQHARFMETLMKNLGMSGLAQLGVAHIDGKPAAAQVWLVRAPQATIFKLAHDPAFDQNSPGTLLTHWMIKQVCERDGAREFDFGRGDDEYKKLWLRNRRFRYGAIAANPRSVRGAWRYMTEIIPTKIGSLDLVQQLRHRTRHPPRARVPSARQIT
jgi:hypothetical protein